MIQPTDSLAGPRESKAPVALSLLLMALGLLLLSLLLLDYATQTAARIMIGASPRGFALPEVELSFAVLGSFLLAWLVSCVGWMHAIASKAPRGAARTIAIGALFGAAIPVLMALSLDAHGSGGGGRRYHFFVAIASGMFMVTPLTVSMITTSAARAHRRGDTHSCARILWNAQVRSLLPAIIAGAIIGLLGMDQGRRPSDFELTLDMILPLAIGVWSYWRAFKTLCAIRPFLRAAP